MTRFQCSLVCLGAIQIHERTAGASGVVHVQLGVVDGCMPVQADEFTVLSSVGGGSGSGTGSSWTP
jgi:hypothetical protein